MLEPRWPFNSRMVANAPAMPGVFGLWEDRELIYIGHASTLREALLGHLEGRTGSCTRAASHYGWRLALDPRSVERDLLAAYEEKHRTLPRCNRRS